MACAAIPVVRGDEQFAGLITLADIRHVPREWDTRASAR